MIMEEYFLFFHSLEHCSLIDLARKRKGVRLSNSTTAQVRKCFGKILKILNKLKDKHTAGKEIRGTATTEVTE